STHAVVLPNILAAMRGRARAADTSVSTIPTTAPAALARTRVEILLSPEMSTTEYIIVMSLLPTYGRVSPEATVETNTFGTPKGRARIALDAITVPAVPPNPMTPSSRPLACSCATTTAAPRVITSMAEALSPD